MRTIHRCTITHVQSVADLSEPVDVFSEWIDHCEAEEKEANNHDDDDEFDDENQRNVRQRIE